MKNFHTTIAAAMVQLNQEANKQFTVMMRNGSMSVEYYAPDMIDLQTPHKQDELYVITSGSGTFFRDGEQVNINKGDVLFVPAGMEHRFENFSNDFATWVIFYGPDGGETEQ